MAGILKVDTIQNANASNIVTQTNSTTITIGTSGQTVALAAGASSSGFGATYNGALNWDTTVKTTGFTAVSGTGYFCNTTSAAFTVTLPATPSAGAIVAFKDYAKTWDTNNLTINGNSSNIEGVNLNYTASTEGLSITLIYVDSTKGWIVVGSGDDSNINPQALFTTATGGTITTSGDYKIHTFTGSGCFVVTQVGNGPVSPSGGPNTVSYMVVAGGAGTSSWSGGGAGGFREGRDITPSYTASPLVAPTGLTITQTTYPVVVGAGGTSGPIPGRYGNNSVFSTITSAGGGAGSCESSANGFSGGSGSGASQTGTGGSGNTPPVSPPQGNPGSPNGANASGGGGGGATGAGGGGAGRGGGTGATTSISGSPTTYAGGGGGANRTTSPASGGSGGGGPSGAYPYPGPQNSGTAGTVNTGGGAGGGADVGSNGGGGSGIVVIRYKYQ